MEIFLYASVKVIPLTPASCLPHHALPIPHQFFYTNHDWNKPAYFIMINAQLPFEIKLRTLIKPRSNWRSKTLQGPILRSHVTDLQNSTECLHVIIKQPFYLLLRYSAFPLFPVVLHVPFALHVPFVPLVLLSCPVLLQPLCASMLEYVQICHSRIQFYQSEKLQSWNL